MSLKPKSGNLPPTKTCQISTGSSTQVLMHGQPKTKTYHPLKHVKFGSYVLMPCAHVACPSMQNPSMPHP